MLSERVEKQLTKLWDKWGPSDFIQCEEDECEEDEWYQDFRNLVTLAISVELGERYAEKLFSDAMPPGSGTQ